MIRTSLLAACVFVGAAASATELPSLSHAMVHAVAQAIAGQDFAPMVGFKVGDTNNYSLSIQSMTGTMVMKVTAVTATQLTIEQDMTIMGQTENVVEVVDPKTGNVISVTVNGQKQDPPAPGDDQITSETPTKITVPAGTFNCEDVKIHTKSSNTDSEQWVDIGGPIPIGGTLKMTSTVQGMPIEADLVSYTIGQ